MKPLTQDERRALRRSLDGAVLNVATYAASLHVGHRIIVRTDLTGRYVIKYDGLRWSLITTPSFDEALRFLDNLGVPGQCVSLGVAA